MDDSIITIIVLAVLGTIQLLTSINKKKRARERILQTWSEEELEGQEAEEDVIEEVTAPFTIRKMMPDEDSRFMTKPMLASIKKGPGTIAADEIIAVEEVEGESPLEHFTPQQAILYSEIINPKWNS